MTNYIVATPRYTTNSNGIKTLHKICHTINVNGGRAFLLFIDSNDPQCQKVVFGDKSFTNPEFNTPPLQPADVHLINSSYVIYPEVIVDNPIKAKNVIRYFGNREAYCNGRKINISPRDFLVAHSSRVRDNANYILFNSEINPAFNSVGSLPMRERPFDLTYIGKGYLYGHTATIKNSILIARDWPADQSQLAKLLKSTRFLYTWDSWTSTNVEAILCGAMPVFLRYDPWTKEDIDGSELGPLPKLDASTPNLQFNYTEFCRAKTILENNIKNLTFTWNNRVKKFTELVSRHFENIDAETPEVAENTSV
ncbi:MAG TPA: hypothetical protein VKC60_11165 [Opitutaceae bacterium]|nr:hypothetical protein [Opitutaceae bacterium]